MFAYVDSVPSSTSLLMQCGYRSKVCTNHRATKLDGTLHKLCEFHRRKANQNQLRLHRRQREQRAARELCAAVEHRPVKKYRLSPEAAFDPFFPLCDFATNETRELTGVGGPSLLKIGAPDMDFLELLLIDMQSLPPLDTFLPSASASADDNSSVIV
ncbi:hypothetical protein V7S43_016451 [Phytophthora oleae]|uniref:SBP-type domain-containing protein n=1 Tax=Phytophthora oleae TaxID=2107226 RepID=A0ABD3EXY9_9STRA